MKEDNPSISILNGAELEHGHSLDAPGDEYDAEEAREGIYALVERQGLDVDAIKERAEELRRGVESDEE